ncbi:Cys-tRNA(Pro)/Cys-tRNA(Cys) deacylase [Desulfosarcina widdelii]|uniref:Cys-tRNA(Pro)/Cys-tRNA(Cys) deacylase n=1 Tax=Desulfosarcina widdelii TaxID=947919 RepID=A0A5K7YYA0_9BACT|nr:aminoacyl-tRNA deacylase [Desulfosarcina widdelii]BBO73395.1 Cys-tRNA(Pro)/Cys-tRNA(Cys) deacylase [Desulfosarcina widdelii]
MAKSKYPITPAVRFLRSKGIDFKPHTYAYSDRGGANQAAQALKVPANRVVKTLVMETDNRVLFLMLMHGDREVSTRQLARVIGRKKVIPAAPATAERCTGCRVGGISPFATRDRLPVYLEESILVLESVFINGGKRGFLVEIDPAVLTGPLDGVAVKAAAS